MSFNSFTKTKVEPVKVGQVWEYKPSYHRGGRIWVRKELRKDFYEVTEIYTGGERNYFVDDILNCANLTDVQPGQRYHDTDQRLCVIVRPWAGRWNSWAVERAGKMVDYDIMEPAILGWTKLPPQGRNVSSSIGSCPICGSAGRVIFTSFECSSSSCRNFRKP